MGGEETFMAGYDESICANCSNGCVCALCSIYEILLVTPDQWIANEYMR